MKASRSPRNVERRRLVPAARPKGLKLPGDFSWQLVGLLADCCSDDYCSELYRTIKGIVRNRDATKYHELGTAWGLQCMSTWPRDTSTLKVAATLLVATTAKKNRTMESVSSSDRTANCLAAIKQLDGSLKCILEGADPVVSYARNWLKGLLGPIPTPDVIADSARHGPGSTVLSRSGQTSTYFKYSDWPYTVTPKARALLTEVIKSDQRWLGVLEDAYRERYRIPKWRLLNRPAFERNILTDVPFNRITTVPKDGSKDRPIAIEPAGNVFLQLGIEGVIRSQLKVYGFDLADQTVNQRLAEEGSRYSSDPSARLFPATLDLSNASDTIGLEVCQLLLPADWFDMLVSVRSPYGLFPDGTGWRYAKMSSMGNGTTFVLETVLFLAIIMGVSAVYGHKSDRASINVYGDDCVYPAYLDAPVRGYLRGAGFIVNEKKSFAAGPVRESCGSDFFLGRNVRPVFMPAEFKTEAHVLSYRNHLNRWFRRHYGLALPSRLDDFFLKYIDVGVGPESDSDFSSYWHLFGASGSTSCFQYCATELPGREFMFRKLMHNLASCSGDEGHFRITRRELGSLRVVKRTLLDDYYVIDGIRQDYVPPAFEILERPVTS